MENNMPKVGDRIEVYHTWFADGDDPHDYRTNCSSATVTCVTEPTFVAQSKEFGLIKILVDGLDWHTADNGKWLDCYPLN